jgi:hypothetical protein
LSTILHQSMTEKNKNSKPPSNRNMGTCAQCAKVPILVSLVEI